MWTYSTDIDLLIEEKILNPANIMQTFRQCGVALHRQDIAELLNLRKGTLFSDESKPQIKQLKRFLGVDGGNESNKYSRLPRIELIVFGCMNY